MQLNRSRATLNNSRSVQALDDKSDGGSAALSKSMMKSRVSNPKRYSVVGGSPQVVRVKTTNAPEKAGANGNTQEINSLVNRYINAMES